MHTHHLRLWVGAILCTLSCAAMAENAITTDVASVRAGPDDSYPEVAQLDADYPIEVMGCLDDWSWCDVTFDGNRGWLYSPDITYEYEGGYVPFYTYAPAFSIPVISFSVDTYWGRYYHDRPWYRDRDRWEHREIQHRPPPGPPPRSAPPPREAVRMDRPHGGPPGDRSIRLGRAEPGQPSREASRDERSDRREAEIAHQRAETDRDRDRADRGAPEHSGEHAMPDRTRDREVPGSAAPEHAQPDRAAPDRPAPPHAALPRPAPPPMHAPVEHQPPQHDARAGERDTHERRRDERPRDEPPHREEPRA